jgi:hypothetical protein
MNLLGGRHAVMHDLGENAWQIRRERQWNRAVSREPANERIVTRRGRMPAVRAVSPLVYRFVAANRRFLLGAASRVFWLKITVMVAFCLGLALSAHLWIGPRSYPPAPLFDALPALDGVLSHTLFIALFGLAAAIAVAPKPRLWIAAFLAVLLVFCLLDQTRWQPWVFQYGFLLAALALFSWDSADAEGRTRTLNIARLVVVSTYLLSGLQKVNVNFFENEFPWIIQPITNLFPSTTGIVHVVGMAVPCVQVAFGIGLLTKRFRRASLILAVSMHVFILAMVGPGGYAWNNVVWPWTAAMALFDILLFAGEAEFSWHDIFRAKDRRLYGATIMLLVIFPLTSFFNVWDSFLSAALYSGNLTEAQIYTTDAGKRALPAAISHYLVHTSPDTNVLNIQRWSIEDLNPIGADRARAADVLQPAGNRLPLLEPITVMKCARVRAGRPDGIGAARYPDPGAGRSS